MFKFKLFLFMAFVFLYLPNIFAMQTPSKLIDTPINTFYSLGEYNLDMSIYKNGGVLNFIELGISSVFNIGFSLDFSNLIGENLVKTRDPEISIRFNIYNGGLYAPSLNLGYLGQGYGDYNNGRYQYSKKGFYLLIDKELMLPFCFWGFGINMPNTETKDIYGFINMRYPISDKILLMVEYDNIRVTPESRLNFGIKYYITDNFSLGIGFRNLNRLIKNNDEVIERVFQLNYLGRFHFLEN